MTNSRDSGLGRHDHKRSKAGIRLRSRTRDSGRANARGFTLIEIIVALAVIAIAMGAIISGMARYAGNAGYLRDKTLALLVAHNRLTEISLEQPAFPAVGTSDGDVEMAGGKWRWSETVSETPDPAVHRIEVRVRIDGAKDDIATLTGFITKL